MKGKVGMNRAELLELLKKARKQLKKYHVPNDEQTVTLSIDTLETALSEQPTIVRCKDCKHGVLCNEGEIDCAKDIGTFKATIHKPDWFCADVEREEGW